MEADGLVTHAAAGGRKVYQITDAGRTELADRSGELARLEAEIHASVADLTAVASEVEKGVRGSVKDLKRELRQASREAQSPRTDEWRRWRDEWMEAGEAAARAATGPGSETELERKVGSLHADVRRWVRAGRATADDLRAAATVVDSVRDQLRRLLRG